MVKAGLMLEARTMAALSPVAQIERPRRVPRKPTMAAPASAMTTAASTSLYPPPVKLRALLAMEKTVSVLTSDMVDEAHHGQIDGVEAGVDDDAGHDALDAEAGLQKAVMKPEHTPAAIAASRARKGWPVSAT